jgi:myo-inositol 2-dehydrogenase / D-chiro-inositol 1-dehydrogenase
MAAEHSPMAKTTTRLRVGFVGCGRATQTLHLPALRRLADWQVVAAADSDEDRLKEIATRFGIPRCYADYQALLANPDVEVVAVCVPPRLHAEVALAAVAAGKHVFIEKPLAVTLGECAELLEQSARSPRKVMVGFNLRWHRLVRRAREMIQDGTLGDLELIRTSFTTGGRMKATSPAWSSWRTPGGGVLFDLGVHHFDLWRYMTGAEVIEISAMNHSHEAGGQSSTVQARMDSGLLVTSAFSNQATDSNELEICGSKGSIRVSCYRFAGLKFVSAGTSRGLQTFASKVAKVLREIPGAIGQARRGGDFHSAYQSEWQAFGQSIRNDTAVECSLEDGRRAVEVVVAASVSDSQCRSVQISKSRSGGVDTTASLSADQFRDPVKNATDLSPGGR